MKQGIIAGCLIIHSFLSIGQGVDGNASGDIKSAAEIKMQRTWEITEKFVSRKSDPARIGLYRYFSAYFTENNIYPNEDAIDLVEAYNQQVTLEDIQSNRQKFKELQYPSVSYELHADRNVQKRRVARINRDLNFSFKMAIDTFNRQYQQLGVLDSLPTSFKKDLERFSGKVLPAINNAADKIPALQMEYFLFSLRDMTALLGQIKQSPLNFMPLLSMSEMMGDFFAYDIPQATRQYRSYGSRYLGQVNQPLYHTARYTIQSPNTTFPDPVIEMPNANVYVYTKNVTGKWDQEPKPNAFNVYYGANGLKYSLTPGCDTLSFFKYHPSVPASTLPVILARGNYCFVLQDITTKQLYLKPDINLRDNQVIDDKKLVKLCFKIE